ncbi:unnamed protein product, partial [Owenia fusiformis]
MSDNPSVKPSELSKSVSVDVDHPDHPTKHPGTCNSCNRSLATAVAVLGGLYICLTIPMFVILFLRVNTLQEEVQRLKPSVSYILQERPLDPVSTTTMEFLENQNINQSTEQRIKVLSNHVIGNDSLPSHIQKRESPTSTPTSGKEGKTRHKKKKNRKRGKAKRCNAVANCLTSPTVSGAVCKKVASCAPASTTMGPFSTTSTTPTPTVASPKDPLAIHLTGDNNKELRVSETDGVIKQWDTGLKGWPQPDDLTYSEGTITVKQKGLYMVYFQVTVESTKLYDRVALVLNEPDEKGNQKQRVHLECVLDLRHLNIPRSDKDHGPTLGPGHSCFSAGLIHIDTPNSELFIKFLNATGRAKFNESESFFGLYQIH